MSWLQPVDGDGFLATAVVDDESFVSLADDTVWASVRRLERVTVCVSTHEDVWGDGQCVWDERSHWSVL